MIDPRRIENAIARAYELDRTHNNMGLAITLAAGEFQVPMARLCEALRARKRRKVEAAQEEAARMWWNK